MAPAAGNLMWGRAWWRPSRSSLCCATLVGTTLCGLGAASVSLWISVLVLPLSGACCSRTCSAGWRCQCPHGRAGSGAGVSPLFSLPFAEEEQGAAPGRDPGIASAESPGGGRDPSQPTEPDTVTSTQLSMVPRAGADGPTGALSLDGAAAGDMEHPEGFPRPPSPTIPTCRPDRPRDAMGQPARTASPGAPGHRVTSPTSATSAASTDSREPGGTPPRGHGSGRASTPVPPTEDAELSGDVAESPRVSPLPPAPSQPQEEGEEQSGALWVPSPVAPRAGTTVPMAEVTVVTPWHTEVPSSSGAPATGGEEAVPRPPGTDHGMPTVSSEEEEDEEEDDEEEEQPAPSAATVEGFLAAIPGEPGGTRRDGLTSPHTGGSGVAPVGSGDQSPSTAAPLPALPTERASVGAGARPAGGPRRSALALGTALLATLCH